MILWRREHVLELLTPELIKNSSALPTIIQEKYDLKLFSCFSLRGQNAISTIEGRITYFQAELQQF
jgi:hypothetical protein